LNLSRYVKESIKNIVLPKADIHEEELERDFFVFKKVILNTDGKKIKLNPLSFGYKKSEKIEGEFIKIERLYPHHAFDESLKGKILYIHHLGKTKNLHYLFNLKPKLVLTNTDVKKPIYSPDFPIFFVPSILSQKKVEISFKVKNSKTKLKNYYLDIGRGPYFVYIHFPFDSRFENKNNIAFDSSLKVTLGVIGKFLNVKYPRGYRIRTLFSDLKFSDYEGLEFHLKNVNKDSILSVFNIENCGTGNEKLIIKNKKYLVDRFHYKKLQNILSRIEVSFPEENLEDYSNIERIDLPVIWFSSQPNDNLYTLKKEFLNEKLILNFTNHIFFLINNIYKENI
jgi:hypothetical protein